MPRHPLIVLRPALASGATATPFVGLPGRGGGRTLDARLPVPAPPRRETARAAVHHGGAPAPARTLVDVLAATAAATPRAPALDDGREVLDYRDLLARVSDGARLLARHGVGRGDRVGVRMTSGTADLYVGILAVLSVGAAYVPVDVDDPPERAELVWGQAGVCAVLGDGAAVAPRPVPPRRTGPGLPDPGDDAWIIFTSGSTGTPKGVAVTHRSAAAFVDAESRLFVQHRPVGPGDRVLGGLSVAFDASCEEMWVAWRHGACLVPAARELVRGGVELGDWLTERGVSVVSTVPTLAALWTPEQLRGVRLLILGGEACPEPLAHRLAGACDEVWNTYGPTETTVVACAARLTTDGPVRIGLPLRGWDLAVVDPGTGAVVDEGGSGELVIAGVGTARYLDAEKDAARFAPLPALGWTRAYRSGDLVRADPEGLVYLGRADSQIKIRGFRVELAEIEAVMLELPAVAQAVVSTVEPQPGLTELAGWYRTEPGTTLDPRELIERLRARLPAHMVPAHLEELAVIPTTTSGKVDRAALPAPRRRAPVRSGRTVAPATATEQGLCDGLAAVLGLDTVSVEDDLFDDLGASSLALAHLCSAVRPTVGPVGIRQVYAHRTLRALAATLDAAGATSAAAPHVTPEPPRERPAPVGPLGHACCGAAQVLVLALMAAAGAGAAGAGLAWTDAAADLPSAFGRAALATLAVVVGLCLLPIAAKWLLVGRWRTGEIRLWSAAYLRFWIVSTLVRSSPLALFAGSPLYLLHLRALGARVGTGSVIVSRTVPVCTDTLTIGSGTVVREGAAFTGYRAEDGVIRVGTVEIGDDAVVGESSYLDVDTAVGDGARLAHASSLHPGQRIPAGEHWHGSPAGPAAPDSRTLPPVARGRTRRVLYTLAQLVNLLVVLPLVVAGATVLDSRDPDLDAWTLPGAGALAQSGFYLRELVVSLGLFGAAVAGGLVVVVVVPRLMRPTLVPGRTYPLYGVAWWCHRVISRVGNAPFFVQLLGDSSYIVGYLRAIGYRASRLGQTGSNAGADLRQHHPHLVAIGRGTMVSDGVGFLTAEVGDSSFRVGEVSLGAHTFLGNQIVVPTGSQLGDNCFVGTKTMVPVDGMLRENTGLLGSPPFPIPRAGQPDSRFDLSRREFGRRLGRKNGHNLRSMALFLGARWARLHVLVMIGLSAGNLYDTLGVGVVAAGAVLAGAVDTALSVLLERASTGFRRLRPQRCSIYDPYFWWHERYWKLSTQPAALNGTTLKPWVWRLLGVRIGRRVFDDGAGISEKSLTSIGDGVALNAGTVLQSHSMEDGVFKSDHVTLGDDVTIGPGAFVHYGVTIGEGAHLSADAFLMKGETIAPGSRWAGNPAQETVAARP